MKLLLDAHVSRPMLDFLTATGNDCVHAELLSPGMSDEAVLRYAYEQGRVVMTADKDFGELVFRRSLPAHGVVLLRLTLPHETERVALFQRFWPWVERAAWGHFVVVTDHTIRRTPLPGA
jgi:predicted nuclease of predicted toxin-antitoxin system